MSKEKSDVPSVRKIARASVIKWSGDEELQTTQEVVSQKKVSSFQKNACHDAAAAVKDAKPSNRYQCSYCNMTFRWQSHWKSHTRTHTGERPFKCNICDKSFARSDGLQCHKLTHFTAKYGRSAFGNASFPPPSLSSFEPGSNPVRDFERSKLFSCNYCSRIFFSSAGVVKHMQVHRGMVHLFDILYLFTKMLHN